MKRRFVLPLAALALCCVLGGTAAAAQPAPRALPAAAVQELRQLTGADGTWRYRWRQADAEGLLCAEAARVDTAAGETVRAWWRWEDGAWRLAGAIWQR